jgi:hypothetical protein
LPNKKYISVFVFLCLLFNTFFGIGQVGFNKFFPFNEWAIPTDLIVNEDSTFTSLAQFNNSVTSTPGLLLTKIDKAGNILLQKDHFSLNSSGYYFFFKNKTWAPVSKRSFIILGASVSTNSTTGILLAKIDATTLDTIWTRFYSVPFFNLPTKNIIKLSSNNFWLIGNKFDNNNPAYISRPIVFKTDTNGNISFRKELPSLLRYSPDALTFDSIAQKMYIGGINYTIPQTPQGYIACLDTSGSVVWNQQIGNYPAYTAPTQIEKRNNYLILSGFKWTNLIGSYDRLRLTLSKINASSGAVIWQKLYGKENIANTLKGFTINSDESIVSCGSYYNSDQGLGLNSDGVILKVNSNGDSLWMHSYNTYTGVVQEFFFDVHPTLDGGYIMCGSPLSGTSSANYNWVIKTNSLGVAPGIATYTYTYSTVGFDSIKNYGVSLQIFPNPAIDKLYLSFSIPIDKSGTKIIIFNGLGEKLREEEIVWENGQAEVKISGLRPGIYYLQLYSDDKTNNTTSIRAKFIVEK